MDNAINETVKLIISLSISGGLFVLALFALKPFMRNRLSKSFQYYIWVVVLLRFILPFSFGINLMDFTFETSNAPKPIEETIIPNINPINPVNINPAITDNAVNSNIPDTTEHQPSTQITADSAEPLNILKLLSDNVLWIWLTGTVISVVWNTLGYLRFIRYVHGAAYAVEIPDCGTKVYKSRFAPTPMLVGMIKPRIYLPDTEYANEQLKNILLHEFTHLRRRDVWLKWFVSLCVSVHWFNPIVYLMRREINRACELSCDEAVIRKLDGAAKQSYGDTLISVVAESRCPVGVMPTTMCEEKKKLKERLVAIMNYKKKTKITVLITAVLAVVIMGSALAFGAGIGSNNQNLIGMEIIYADVTEYSSAMHIKWDNRVYSADNSLCESDAKNAGLLGKQFAYAFDGEHRYNVFECNGYTPEEYIIVNFDKIYINGTKSRYNVFKADTSVSEAVNKLINSLKYTNEELSFIIPKSYPNPEKWNILISGREYSDNFGGTSVHFFADINESHTWEAGKKYVIPTANKKFTDLIMLISLSDGDGNITREINLLNYILPASNESYNIPLADLRQLAAKGDELIWEDFNEYKGQDVLSGLYSMFFNIEGGYALLVAGGEPSGKPMYTRFGIPGAEEVVDIRYNDIDEFIGKYPVPDELSAQIYGYLEKIMSSPSLSSNSADYIEEHQSDYNTILDMGVTALPTLTGILNNGDMGLRGIIAAALVQDIIAAESVKPQSDWRDGVLQSAASDVERWSKGFPPSDNSVTRNEQPDNSDAYMIIAQMAELSTSLSVAEYTDEIVAICDAANTNIFSVLADAEITEPSDPLYVFATGTLDFTSSEIFADSGINPSERPHMSTSASWSRYETDEEFEAKRGGMNDEEWNAVLNDIANDPPNIAAFKSVSYFIFYNIMDKESLTIDERDFMLNMVESDMQNYLEGLSEEKLFNKDFEITFLAELKRVAAQYSNEKIMMTCEISLIEGFAPGQYLQYNPMNY